MGSCSNLKRVTFEGTFLYGPVLKGLQLEEQLGNLRKGMSRCFKQPLSEMRAKEMEKHRRHP